MTIWSLCFLCGYVVSFIHYSLNFVTNFGVLAFNPIICNNVYENKNQPIVPLHIFYKRVLRNLFYMSVLLSLCLLIGILGYHYTAGTGWLDSLHNASMILSGMGPVITIETKGGKLFSSFYALFSGVAFITNIGVLVAPVAHRFFHRLHLEED